ncbi:NAD-dependent epimerase/dehydratase family protein [Verrucomicrobia bacterium]|nr:NAD-dependent epimerase/dehydratase family protein [Verrucomicrobiota bacterium]
MKILVTGGTGFIGHSLAKRLLAVGHEVHVVGRSASPPGSKNFAGIVYHPHDLSIQEIPPSIISRTDFVFHIAAKAGIGGPYSSYYRANYQATVNLLKSCVACQVPRMVFTSSPSVVFSESSIRDGNESLAYVKSNLSSYATTKALAERAVLEAHAPGTFQTLALRPHLVWGEGDPHLLPKVIQRHRAGKLRIVGTGENHVDLTHIDNVCHAHLCGMQTLLENKTTGGKAYFIGQNEPVRLWAWLNDLFEQLNLPPLKRKVSFGKAYLAGLILEKSWPLLRLRGDPPMTRFVACQLAHDHWFSLEAAKKDLGYEPIQSMAESLEKSLDWLRAI